MITSEQSAKPLLVVSTCGTSLLTNGASGDLGGLLRRTANHREAELTPEERDLIRQRVQDRVEALGRATLEEVRSLSAELNGLMGVYADQVTAEARGRNHHIFLHTDTFQGQEVARLLLRWTEAKGLVGETLQVDKLNTSRMEDFREGMGNLTDWCAEILPGYRDGGVSGGLQPHRRVQGSPGFHADPGDVLTPTKASTSSRGSGPSCASPGSRWTWTKGPGPS